MKKTQLTIDAVLFDFDGTLTLPGAHDFLEMKRLIGCPENVPILEYLDALEPEENKKAAGTLEQLELEAARKSSLEPDAIKVIEKLKALGLSVGILTRNSRIALETTFSNLSGIRIEDFDTIVTRDDPGKPKPSGDGVQLAAGRMKTTPERTIMVGDYIFDVEAGKNAGSITVFLDNGTVPQPPESDYKITSLVQLLDIMGHFKPLPPGKLPNHLLKSLLSDIHIPDSSILIPPGVGEDTAAIDCGKPEVLILKSDPITFATDAAGHYAVLVNANDIATSGARPRWFQATLLYPPGSTFHTIRKHVGEIGNMCRKWRIIPCGGHTEITDAVTRPIISGFLSGTVERKHLIDKRNMNTGDSVLMTKTAGLEGTSVIAREFPEHLVRFGLSREEVDKGKNFLFSIGILKEAEIAAKSAGTSSMHDVTEGGVATALSELSIAGGHRIRIHPAKIPISPLTARICGYFDIDPLGLIGSGSLLITCRKNYTDNLITTIEEAGIQVSWIGEVLEEGEGIHAVRSGEPVKWPTFDTDEITRLFP